MNAHTTSERNTILSPSEMSHECVQTGVSEMSQECVQNSLSVQPTNHAVSEMIHTDEMRIPTECVQSIECVQTSVLARSSQTGSSTSETPSIQVAGRNIRARFKLSKIEGGRFSLKMNSTEKKVGPVKEGVYLNDENGSDRISFSKTLKNTLPARDEIRGENQTFNNIEIVKTPKRKNEHTVSKLVHKFSASACNLPGVDISGESPAKRRRLWGQGGQGH